MRALLPFFVLLAGWALVFGLSAVRAGPSGKGLGGDFAIFYAATHLLQHGGNPYDPHAVYHAEAQLLGSQRVPVPRFQPFIRVGNPPLFFWLLGPLTRLSYHAAAMIWLVSMEILLLAGAYCLIHVMRWTRPLLPLLVFALMPQTMLAAYYGNVDALVFGGLAGGVVAARRQPVLASCLLTAAWLKPPVALPLVLLIILFNQSRSKLLAGFGACTAGLFALMLLSTGWNDIEYWWTALTGYSRQIAVQPDLASLSGLYVYWASATLRTALEAIAIAVALGLTVWWWLRIRGRDARLPLAAAWLWFVWYLAAPFAHYHDQVLLAIPALGLMGIAGAELGRASRLALLYLLLFSLLLFPTSRLHTDLQSLALIPVAVVAFYAARGQSRRPSDVGSRRSDFGE